MKLGDEPQLRLQVGSVFLGGDVTQEVLVSHPGCEEYIPLVLPRLLILHRAESCVQVRQRHRDHLGEMNQQRSAVYLLNHNDKTFIRFLKGL